MKDHENCGCENDNEQEPVIYITFEDSEEEVACSVLGIFDVGEKEYIALVPMDTDDDVLLYRYYEDDEELKLDDIETDEEYDEVTEAFEKIFFSKDNIDEIE